MRLVLYMLCIFQVCTQNAFQVSLAFHSIVGAFMQGKASGE